MSTSVEVEIARGLGDWLVARLAQGLLESLGQRVAAILLGRDRLLEERLASGGLLGEDLVCVVEFRAVCRRRLDVTDDAPQVRVDDERGRTARTRHFEFGCDLGHGHLPFSSQSIATGLPDASVART